MKNISNQEAKAILGGDFSDSPLYKILLWGTLANDALNIATDPESRQDFMSNLSTKDTNQPAKDSPIGPNKSDLK